uniref:Signal transducer and activator of transcription n=1 Tax=Sphenodon punctatus TaxID=8508 RepID=A0A8D0GFY0_SPHPU
MAQWLEVQQLESTYLDQVHQLYSDDQLPMEVRQYLAHWIEDQNWIQAAEPDSPHTHMLFHTLLSLLDDQMGRLVLGDEENILLTHNLRRAKLNLQSRYQEQPKELANIIANLLREERVILVARQAVPQARAEPPPNNPRDTGRQQNIERRLVEVRASVQDLERTVRHLEELQDTFDFHYKMHNMLAGSTPSDPEVVRQLQQLQSMLNSLDRDRKDVLAQVQALLGRTDTLRELLQEELGEWQQRQRRAVLREICDTSLDRLEKWFTADAELLFQLLRLLRTLGELVKKVTYQHDPLQVELPLLERRLREQLSCLLRSSFVVEKQPIMSPSRRPLVLKTGNKFSVGARLLVTLQDRSCRMEVKIEVDKNPPNVRGFRRFNILTSNRKTMVLDGTQTNGLVCDFQYMTLKEQKAGSSGKGKGIKGAGEGLLAVTEELHLITFTLDYCYHDLKLQIETSTLPVVIISNVNQASSAWAAILWFNMLSPDPGDIPTFSFWTWLDGILNLIRDHLAELWKAGLILGFVSRKQERKLLKDRRTGTFLLRFSESTRDGGITCTWVEHGEGSSPKYQSVDPYTSNELAPLSLPDIIRDYQLLALENIPENPLQFLYPSTPRDEAFAPYYKERREADLMEHRKYLNRRLIRVSSRQPEEQGAVEGSVDPPAVDGQQLEAQELLANQQPEVLGLQANQELEVFQPVDNHLPAGAAANHLDVLGQELAMIMLDQTGADNYLLLQENDPFLPPPGEEQQLPQYDVFGEVPVLQVDAEDFQ